MAGLRTNELMRVLESQKHGGGEFMANQTESPEAPEKIDPAVAATLTGIIYQAKLLNRQAKVNVPEEEIVVEVLSLWRIVMDSLRTGTVPGIEDSGAREIG
jgi:hypothetical protein